MASWVGPLYGRRSSSVARRELDRFPILHRRLLDEYVHVLQEASTPRASKWARKLVGDPASRSPYASRKLAEAHIRRRLLTLAAIYCQLGVIHDRPLGAELVRAGRDCETFAGTLSAWRLPTVLAILPLVIGVLGQIRGALADVNVESVIGAAVAYVLYGAALAFVFVRRAFRHKRKLFYPNAAAAERPGGAGDADDGRNVYRSERELFDALGWAKPIEAPLDQIAVALVTSSIALAILAFGIIVVKDPDQHAGVWYSLTAASLVIGVLPIRLGLRTLGRRRWR
jgi:hypothetical protein